MPKSKLSRKSLISFRRKFIKDFTLNMIDYYKRKDSKSWYSFLGSIKKTRATRANEYAQIMEGNKESDMEMRWMIRLPGDFSRALDDILQEGGEDRFWKDEEELHWFMNEFPQFTIAKKQ